MNKSKGQKVSHFNITFAVPNHQLNHQLIIKPLTTGRLKKNCTLASSDFCRNYTGKNQPHNSYRFLIKPLGNYPPTDTHTFWVL